MCSLGPVQGTEWVKNSKPYQKAHFKLRDKASNLAKPDFVIFAKDMKHAH